MALCATQAVAQPTPTRLKYKVDCATCRVEFTPVATLGKRSDPGGIAEAFALDQDSRGRFFAVSYDFQVLVYDGRGTLIKTLGRRGPGPGEFNVGMAAQLLPRVGRGDSLFVFQLLTQNVTVFSPDLVYARTMKTAAFNNVRSITALPDGRWLISGASRAPASIGRELHIMDSMGAIKRSFGPEQAMTPSNPFITIRSSYVSPKGTAIHLGTKDKAYRSETMSMAGDRIASFEITDVPYLPKGELVAERRPDGRVFQRSIGFGSVELWGVDTVGQLWILGIAPPEVKDRKARLEIVDPRTGTTRSSQIVPTDYLLLPRGNRAYSRSVADDGFTSYTVYSYRFAGR
jgi:hypothetical protein